MKIFIRFCKNAGKRGEKVGAIYIFRYGILFMPKEVRENCSVKSKENISTVLHTGGT